MRLERSKINNILVISLSNIGDVILTFPVVDVLRSQFPLAKISIVIGPKAQGLLNGNVNFEKVYIFDKHQSFLKTLKLISTLRNEHFDLAVDLRNTAIPILISAKYRTPLSDPKNEFMHMKDKHLARLRSAGVEGDNKSGQRYCISISKEDRRIVDEIINSRIGKDQKFVIIAPGAASSAKRWSEDSFTKLHDSILKSSSVKVIYVGNNDDKLIAERIISKPNVNVINFCGLLTLTQLAYLMNFASVMIVNDSSPMHLASYLDRPVLAIFGASDPKKYGPWSGESRFVRSDKQCPACAGSENDQKHECMDNVSCDDVLAFLKITSTDVCLVK